MKSGFQLTANYTLPGIPIPNLNPGKNRDIVAVCDYITATLPFCLKIPMLERGFVTRIWTTHPKIDK